MALQALTSGARASNSVVTRRVGATDFVSARSLLPDSYRSLFESTISDIQYKYQRADETARAVDKSQIDALEKVGNVDLVRVSAMISEVRDGRLTLNMLASISDNRPTRRASSQTTSDSSLMSLVRSNQGAATARATPSSSAVATSGSASNVATGQTKSPIDLLDEYGDSVLVYRPEVQMVHMNAADKAHIMKYKSPEYHNEPVAKFIFLYYRLVQLQGEAMKKLDRGALASNIPLLTEQTEFWSRIKPEWKPFITLGNVNGSYGPPKPGSTPALECKSRPYMPDNGIQHVVASALADFDVFNEVCRAIYLNGIIPKLAVLPLATFDNQGPDGQPRTIDPYMLCPELRPLEPIVTGHPMYSFLHGTTCEIGIKYPSAYILGKTPRDPRLLPDPRLSGLGKACLYRTVMILPPSPFIADTTTVSEKINEVRVISYWMFGEKETYQILRGVSPAKEFRKFTTHPELLTSDLSALPENAPVNLLLSPDVVTETLMQSAAVDMQVANAIEEYGILNSPLKIAAFIEAETRIRESAVFPMVARLAPFSGARSCTVREINPQNMEVAKAQREKDRLKRGSYVAKTVTAGTDPTETSIGSKAQVVQTASTETPLSGDTSVSVPGTAAVAPRDVLRFQWYATGLRLGGPFSVETYRWVHRNPKTGMDSFYEPSPDQAAVPDDIAPHLRLVRVVDLDLDVRRVFYRFGIESDQMHSYGFSPDDHHLPPQLIMLMVANSTTIQQGVVASGKQAQKAQNVFYALFSESDKAADTNVKFKRDILTELSKCNNGLSNFIASMLAETQIARFVIELDDTERAARVAQLVKRAVTVALDFSLTDKFSAIYARKVFLDLRETITRVGHRITAETAAHLESFIAPTKSICGVGLTADDKTITLVNSRVGADGKSGVVASIINEARQDPRQSEYSFYVVTTQLYNDREKGYTDVPPEVWEHIFCSEYYNLRDNIPVAKYLADCKVAEPPTSLVENRLKLRNGLSAPFLLYVLAPEKSISDMADERFADRAVFDSLASTLRKNSEAATRNRLRKFIASAAPAAELAQLTNNNNSSNNNTNRVIVASEEDEKIADIDCMDVDADSHASDAMTGPVIEELAEPANEPRPGLKRTHSEMMEASALLDDRTGDKQQQPKQAAPSTPAPKKAPTAVPSAPKKPMPAPAPVPGRAKATTNAKSNATAVQRAIITASDSEAEPRSKVPKIE